MFCIIAITLLPNISLQLPIIISPIKLGRVADKELILIQKFVSTLIFAFAAMARLVLDSLTSQIDNIS